MPIPSPLPDESKNEFVSRCISTLKKTDSGLEDDQIAAICYSQWDKREKSFAAEFLELLNYLTAMYGKQKAREYFDRWLQTYNLDPYVPMSLQKAKMLVFRRMPETRHHIKEELERKLKFEIVDEKNHVIAGYAATPICDLENDRCDINAIRKAAEDYMAKGLVFFADHVNKPAGVILEEYVAPSGKVYRTHVDEVGWFIVCRPTKEYWEAIKQGKYNGFSVGWKRHKYSPTDRNLVVELEYDDVSIVKYPCNPLCFFREAKEFDVDGFLEKCAELGGFSDEERVKLKQAFLSFDASDGGLASQPKTKMEGGKTMEELAKLKEELVSEFPEVKEKIEEVSDIEKLKELKAELLKVKAETDVSVDELVAAVKAAREAKMKEQASKALEKVTAAEASEKVKELEAKYAESQAKIKELEAKLKEFDDIKAKFDALVAAKGKGFGASPEPTVERPSVVEVAMGVNLIQNPKGLLKIVKCFEEE